MWWLVVLACGSKPEMEAVPTPAKVEKEAPKKRVLLTFDDIPSQVGKHGPTVTDEDQREAINGAILEELTQRQIPALGFANCGNASEDNVHLKRWLLSGIPVGNHTSTHLTALEGTPEEWGEDVLRCEKVLQELAGAENRWFRFPYLKRGPQDRKAQLMTQLDELRLTAVPVTAATSEWYLAARYADTEDEAVRAELETALVKHMSWSLEVAQEQAEARFDRDDVVHITLMHVNELTAKMLPQVLDQLQEDGWTFVDVDTAMADPLYALEDQVNADASLSWLYRAKALGVDEAYPFGERERDLKVEFGQ